MSFLNYSINDLQALYFFQEILEEEEEVFVEYSLYLERFLLFFVISLKNLSFINLSSIFLSVFFCLFDFLKTNN